MGSSRTTSSIAGGRHCLPHQADCLAEDAELSGLGELGSQRGSQVGEAGGPQAMTVGQAVQGRHGGPLRRDRLVEQARVARLLGQGVQVAAEAGQLACLVRVAVGDLGRGGTVGGHRLAERVEVAGAVEQRRQRDRHVRPDHGATDVAVR
jgi:hypothetical protein